jgi:hypothetical protein
MTIERDDRTEHRKAHSRHSGETMSTLATMSDRGALRTMHADVATACGQESVQPRRGGEHPLIPDSVEESGTGSRPYASEWGLQGATLSRRAPWASAGKAARAAESGWIQLDINMAKSR